MKREECWMTFSESLEAYLTAREDIHSAQGRRNNSDIEVATFNLGQAAEHLDCLTSKE